MHVFYTPDIASNLELPEEEAGHCLRVLRLSIGDEIMLTDGKGCFYKAVISAASGKRCQVKVTETIPQEKGWNGWLHIAMAPTKNMDRTEWFTEKATEIGFDELSFLNCRYSERKVIKKERIEKILVSAVKQSLKATMPVLNEMTDFNKFVSRDFKGQKFIAHCYEGSYVEVGGKRISDVKQIMPCIIETLEKAERVEKLAQERVEEIHRSEKEIEEKELLVSE